MRAAVVDAFTDRPFRGNPAAVVLVQHPVDDAWRQSVAAELSLSETAFLARRDDADWDLRWFTPLTEVALCGHATLAAAHWLAEDGLAVGRLMFHTAAGPLRAERTADGRTEIDLPLVPVVDRGPLPGAESAFPGVPVSVIGRTGHPDPMQVNAVVEVPPAAIRSLQPDLGALAALPVGGVVVTAAADEPGVDLLSRYFAPRLGIPEDPVTGSAHCTLVDVWADRLGRDRLVAHQVSARGGVLDVERRGHRVHLVGGAVTVWEGELRV